MVRMVIGKIETVIPSSLGGTLKLCNELLNSAKVSRTDLDELDGLPGVGECEAGEIHRLLDDITVPVQRAGDGPWTAGIVTGNLAQDLRHFNISCFKEIRENRKKYQY